MGPSTSVLGAQHVKGWIRDIGLLVPHTSVMYRQYIVRLHHGFVRQSASGKQETGQRLLPTWLGYTIGSRGYLLTRK